MVPEAGEKGTQWRHCGVSVPPPGSGCRAASYVLMIAPPDGQLAETPCNTSVWAEHAAFPFIVKLLWSTRLNQQATLETQSYPSCVCLDCKNSLTLTKVPKIHFEGALTGSDGRPRRNPQRAHEDRHCNGLLLSSIMFLGDWQVGILLISTLCVWPRPIVSMLQ